MSVAQVVRSIIEQLSEGISQLVLTVIVLSEQNAPMPDQLPAGAAAVNQTAASLANIARKLAATNYKDFPSIKEEITEAASAVDNATGVMAKAIQNMQTSGDRRTGWQGLVDACRVMSGKTIRLLQIVYGADLARLLLIADDICDKIDDVDTGDLLTDPAKFRDKAQVAAQATAQMAQYLNQRANDTESPLVKEAMLKDAANLQQKANDLIGHVNACLSDTRNPEKARTAQTFLDDLKKDVKKAADYTKETAPEAPTIDLPPQMLPESGIPASFDTGARVPPPSRSSPAAKEINAVNATIDNIAVDAHAGDSNAFVGDVRKAPPEIEALKQAIANQKDNMSPERAKKVETLLHKLDQAFPQQVRSGKEVLQGPNSQNKKGLDNDTDAIGDLLDEIMDVTSQPSLAENAERLKAISDKVPGTTGPVRDSVLKALNDVANKLQPQAAYEAQETNNQMKRDAIHKDLGDLGTAVFSLNKEANAGNTPAARQAADKVKQVVDRLVENTQSKPDDALQRLIQEARTVRNDAVRGDSNSLNTSVPDLQRAAQQAVLLAKQAIANIHDEDESDRRYQLSLLADLIPDAVKEEAVAAQGLVNQPSDGIEKQRVNDAAKKVEDLANQLRDALRSKDPSLGKESLVRGPADAAKKAARDLSEASMHNPKDLGERGHTLKNAIGHLKDKAQQAAVEASDPKKARDIQDSVKAVEEAFPNYVQVASVAARAPNDTKAKADLEKAKKEIEEKIEAVASAASPPSLNENLDNLSKLAQELSAEKRKGDNKGVEDKLRKMGQVEKTIHDQIDFNKKFNKSPEEAEAINRAMKRVSDTVDATRDDVHKGEDWPVVNRDCDDIRKAVQELKDATHAKPLAEVAMLRQIAENLKNEANATAPGWQNTGNKLRGDAKDLAQNVRDVAKNIKDPGQKQKALKAASELEEAADKEYFAANSVVANPGNPKAKAALDDGYDRVDKVLKDLEESLLNKYNPNDDLVVKRHPGEVSDSPFKHKIDAAKRQAQEIVDAAESDNPAAIAPATNKLKEILEDLTRDANGVISDPDRDEKVRQDVMDSANAFNETFSPIIANAQAVLTNPQNVVAKQGLHGAKDNLDNVLDDFEKATQQPSLKENLEQMKKVLDKVNGDKQRGNQKALEEDYEALEELHNRVKDQGDYLAAINKDPRKRHQIKNNLADLDAIINAIKDNVKNIHSSPKDMADDVTYAKTKIDDIMRGTNAVPLSGINDVARANQASLHAAERNNPAYVKRDADKVVDRAHGVLAQVREAAKDPHTEPDQQKKLARAGDNLERALGKYKDVAGKTSANPTAHKSQLKDASEGLDSALDDVSKALKNTQSVSNPNDSDLKDQIDEAKGTIGSIPGGAKNPQDLHREIAALNKKLDDLDNAARVVAASKEPAARKAIMDAVGGSKQAVPALQAALAKHIQDPNNKQHKEEVEIASENAKDHLDDLEEKTRPPSLVEAAAALKKALDDVTGGHGRRSPQDSEKALRDLADTADNFLARANHQAGNNADRNARDSLLADVNALANALSNVDGDVRRNAPLVTVQGQANNAKQQADNLLNKMNAHATQDAQEVAREAMALKRAANAGNVPLVNEKTNALRAAIAKAQGSGKSAQNSLPPEQAKRALEALSKLPQTGEAEVAASGCVIRNPNDAASRSQLRVAQGDVQDAVNTLVNALTNANPDPGVGEVFYVDDEELHLSSESEDDQLEVVAFDPTTNVPPPDSSSPLSRDIDRLKQIVKDVKDNADRRDAMGVAINAKKEQTEAAGLLEKVKDIARAVPSEKYKGDLLDAGDKLEKAIPCQLLAAKNILEATPAEQETRKKELVEATQKVVDALDNLEAVSRQPDLATNNDRIKQVVGNVAGGVKSGDRHAVSDGVKKAVDLGNKMKQQGDYIASKNTNPEERKKIAERTNELKKVIGSLENAANQGRADLDREAAAIVKAGDDLIAAAYANPLAALQRALNKTIELEKAGERGDVDGLVDVSPALNEAVDDLIARVKVALVGIKEPIQHKKIEDANEEVPHAVKAALVAAKYVIDHPTDPQAKAKLRAATEDLKDVLGSLDSALQNKEPAPKEKQDLDRKLAALEALLPKLEKEKKSLQDNPRNPRHKAKVISAANKVGDKAKDIAEDFAPKQDQSDLENRTARGRVKDMVKAINDHNYPGFKRIYACLEKELPAYQEHAVRAVGNDLERARELEEALHDINYLMPKVAHAAREVEADPTSTTKRNNFQVAAQKLDRALARANEKATPPKDERDVRDAAANLRDKLARIRGSRRNQPQLLADEIEDFRKVRDRLRRAGERGEWNPEVGGSSKELEDAWAKFGVRNKQAAASPKPTDDAEIASMEQRVEASLTKLEKATNANSIAAVLDVDSKLSDVLAAVEAQQPQRAMANLQKLSAVVGSLQRELDGTPASSEARDFIEPVKDFIRKSNDSLQNPGDEAKEKEVKEVRERAKVHLIKATQLLDPHSGDRIPRVELQQAKAALADVTAACRTGNPTAIRAALEKAKTQIQTASAVTKKMADGSPSSQNRNSILEAVRDLDNTLKKYEGAADSNANLVELISRQADDSVDDVLEAINNGLHDNLIRATAAVVKDSGSLSHHGKEMPPKEVGTTADDVLKHAREMLGKGNKHSEELGKEAVKPLAQTPRYAETRPQVVDSIVRSRPQRAQPPPASVLIGDLNALAAPKPKPVTVVAPPPAPKPTPKVGGSLEDVVEQVADDITAKGKEFDCAQARDIGYHLTQLAKHARSGQKQQMLEEARAASLKIAELCKILRAKAAAISGKNLAEKTIQDRLIRAAQALQNYGMQLKILTSVKAASVATDKDTDESLASIVRGIGSVVDEGLTSMDITDRTILKLKK